MKKVALVTGATSELGEKVIGRLLERGCIVYAASREKTRIRRKYLYPVVLDVRNDNLCKTLIKKIVDEARRLDYLINIAGYTISGSSLSFSTSDFKNLIDTNLLGPFRLIKEVYPVMKKQEGGRIVNITSLNGLVSLPNFGLYSASKHALEALGNALYYELFSENIFVTNVAPGAIKKEREKKPSLTHKPAREKFFILKFLMPMLSADEVASRIVDLLDKKTPPPTLVLGMDSKIVLFLRRILPGFLWSRLLRFIWEK